MFCCRGSFVDCPPLPPWICLSRLLTLCCSQVPLCALLGNLSCKCFEHWPIRTDNFSLHPYWAVNLHGSPLAARVFVLLLVKLMQFYEDNDVNREAKIDSYESDNSDIQQICVRLWTAYARAECALNHKWKDWISFLAEQRENSELGYFLLQFWHPKWKSSQPFSTIFIFTINANASTTSFK